MPMCLAGGREPPQRSLVLADPQIKAVAGHERLDPAVAGRAAVVEIDDVGNEIGAPDGEPADRVRLDIIAGLEIVLRPGEALAERKDS